MKEEVDSKSPPKPDQFTHLIEEWCAPLQAFMETDRKPAELMQYPHELVGELDSPLSKYLRGIAEFETDMPTEDPPGAMGPHNLLPVRLSGAKAFFKGTDRAVSAWVLSMVEVLNFHATMGKMRTGPATLTAAQELMLTRLPRAVEDLWIKVAWSPSLPSTRASWEESASTMVASQSITWRTWKRRK